MFICLNSLIGVGEAEMEKKDKTFNYLRSYTQYNYDFKKYSELITSGVITFGVAINANCNNA